MNKIEKLKEYLEERNLELEEIEFDADSIQDVKLDLVKYCKYYLNCFDEFVNIFGDCKDKEIVDFIQKNRLIYDLLILPFQKINDKSVYIKHESIFSIQNKVRLNKVDIDEFVYVIGKLFKKKESLKDKLDKLKEDTDKDG